MQHEYRSQMQLRALISTIEPVDGGVPSMTKWFCTLLEEHGIVPTLAWYAPWRNYPHLSVPIHRLATTRPGIRHQYVFGKYHGYGIGAWCPELEFTHYLPVDHWKKLVSGHHLHFVVSGNVLAATPFVFLRTPSVAWIATPWEADRSHRVVNFSRPRRLLDRIINTPILQHLEAKLLRSSLLKIISLSRYTSHALSSISGKSLPNVMLIPVDTCIYHNKHSKTIQWRIGFAGRYCDPRKNIELLLKAVRILVNQGHSPEVILVGDKDYLSMQERVVEYGLSKFITCYQHMEPPELSCLLQTLDVFVIPSYQEGLCISALEAMACGVPIISTRCGGPEEYVITDETGELTDFSPVSFSRSISSLCLNRNKRECLSQGAYSWIVRNASIDASKKLFADYLSSLIQRNNLEGLYKNRWS